MISSRTVPITLTGVAVILATLGAREASAYPQPDLAETACARPAPALVARAQGGDAAAARALGLGYLHPRCGAATVDLGAAMDWLERAAGQGDVAAAVRLAILFDDGALLPPDRARARVHYLQAAHGGVVPAQHRLGILLVAGEGGRKDTDGGLRWLAVAAAHGDPSAAAALALLRARGYHGVPVDVCAAVDWLETAARLGAPAALPDLRAELAADRTTDC